MTRRGRIARLLRGQRGRDCGKIIEGKIMKTDQRGRFPFFEPLSGYEIPDKAETRPRKNNVGRILTLPPIGVPRLRGFLEQGSPDRLKTELQTGQSLGLRRGQCQDARRIMCRIKVADWPMRHYTGTVKFSSLAKVLAMVAALLVIGTGCGGFAASSTVSPLMFLLPGLAQTKPALPQPPAPVQTAHQPDRGPSRLKSMRFPLAPTIKIARHIITHKVIKRTPKFALVLQLEPLHTCNLTCTGCGRIREYSTNLKDMMPLEDCLAAAQECEAPMVSICGGEPLIYPKIEELTAGLLKQGRFVYVCTNGMFMRKKMRDYLAAIYDRNRSRCWRNCWARN